MIRSILDEAQIHPAIRAAIASNNADVVAEVKAAIAANPVVVVGMAHNPFVRKSRKTLDAAQVPYTYLEYGNYLGGWRRHNALKMWSGWPTLPMIFIDGILIGGANDLQRLVANGELSKLRKA